MNNYSKRQINEMANLIRFSYINPNNTVADYDLAVTHVREEMIKIFKKDNEDFDEPRFRKVALRGLKR